VQVLFQALVGHDLNRGQGAWTNCSLLVIE
jgi:hypothetical protein